MVDPHQEPFVLPPSYNYFTPRRYGEGLSAFINSGSGLGSVKSVNMQ